MKQLLADGGPGSPREIVDMRGLADRYGFSQRTISNFLAQGMPHLKVGQRRVRIVVEKADAWMQEKFGTARFKGPGPNPA